MSKKRKGKHTSPFFTIAGWIVAIFLLVVGLAFLPSAASIILISAGVLCIPVKPLRALWNRIPKGKIIKPVLITVLFLLGIVLSPDNNLNLPIVNQQTETELVPVDVQGADETSSGMPETDAEPSSDSLAAVEAEETAEPPAEVTPPTDNSAIGQDSTHAPTPTPTSTSTPKPTSTPKATSTPKPTKTPAPTSAAHQGGSFSLSDIPGYTTSPYAVVNNNVPYFTDAEIAGAFSSYETYAELDRKGRCGACIASIGRDLMPTETRGEIGSVKPSGWIQAKYNGLVDGNYLYNRCHLIGYQLSGENANVRNLITGTRYLNVDGMLPFENMVADYVKETGNHVLYRVTPIFDGDNLLASGVLMEAASIEDGGEGILFCVFCYNVQPGVAINYADGSSSLTSDTSVTPTQAPSVESQYKYAVNPKNGKIHIIGACAATGSGDSAMTDPKYFVTYEEAEEYSKQVAPKLENRRCGNCWK